MALDVPIARAAAVGAVAALAAAALVVVAGCDDPPPRYATGQPRYSPEVGLPAPPRSLHGPRPPATLAACRAGRGDACYQAGKTLYRASAVLVSACASRPDSPLCQDRAMLARQRRRVAAALALFDRGCDTGSLPACVVLGMAYRDGEVVLPKPERAQQLLTKACTSRHVGGCVALGELYEGRGRAGDLSAATVYFRRACLLGYGRGCAKLAEAYRKGRGVSVDPARARSLRRRACKLGDHRSCAARR